MKIAYDFFKQNDLVNFFGNVFYGKCLNSITEKLNPRFAEQTGKMIFPTFINVFLRKNSRIREMPREIAK